MWKIAVSHSKKYFSQWQCRVSLTSFLDDDEEDS